MRKHLLLLAYFLCFLIFHNIALTQNFVSIRVIDKITRRPIVGANVYSDASHNNNRKISNGNGVVILEVPSEKVRINVLADGYVPVSDREFTYTSGTTNSTFTIELNIDDSNYVIYGRLVPVNRSTGEVYLRIRGYSDTANSDKLGFFTFVVNKEIIDGASKIEMLTIFDGDVKTTTVRRSMQIIDNYIEINLYNSKYSDFSNDDLTYLTWEFFQNIQNVFDEASTTISPSYLKYELISNTLRSIDHIGVDGDLIEFINLYAKYSGDFANLNKRIEDEILEELGRARRYKAIESVTDTVMRRYEQELGDYYLLFQKLEYRENELAETLNQRYPKAIFLNR